MRSDFSLKPNTHDEGCDPLEEGRPSGARTKNRTPGARSGPSVGHRQPRPPDLGAPQNPKFTRHVPTDNPPKSSIFTKFEKDAPPASRSEPLSGHPHTA